MITAHAVAMQHASQLMSLRLLKACKAWYCIGFFERILKSIRYLHALHAMLAFKYFGILWIPISSCWRTHTRDI